MPYVNVQITPENLTRDKKAQLVAAITDALVTILDKKPDHTHIVIEEIAEENWGYAGQLTDDYRKSKQ
jgi:4-oxalocrotonate tautomerase